METVDKISYVCYASVRFWHFNMAAFSFWCVRAEIIIVSVWLLLLRNYIGEIWKMLYSVVRLKSVNQSIVVPSAWCRELNSARAKNFGIRPTKQIQIFYSPNEFTAPDFSKVMRIEFRPSEEACSKGFVVKTFGEYHIGVSYSILLMDPSFFRQQECSESLLVAKRPQSSQEKVEPTWSSENNFGGLWRRTTNKNGKRPENG